MMKELMQEILPNKMQFDVLEGTAGPEKPESEITDEGPNEKPEPVPLSDDTRESPSEVPPVGQHLPVREEDRAIKEPPLR
jgi:hypothetical protein